MVRPIPLPQPPEASRILLHTDGAGIKSAATANNRRSTVGRERLEPTDDQLETQLLIEIRYQQHLAQQGLQELFESGELGFF